MTSLALARDLKTPFVVVVVQNGGGRIFEQLPLGSGPGNDDEALSALYRRTLEGVSTPHAYEFAHAAAMFGYTYARVTTQRALADAHETAYASAGAKLIEAIVPPHGAVAELRRLVSGVEARLGA